LDPTLSAERVLTAGTGISFTDAGANSTLTISVNAGAVDHGGLGGLADDDHTQYALLAGRAGGQQIIGGTENTDSLILQATSNGTPTTGAVIFRTTSGREWGRIISDGASDDVLIIGTTTSFLGDPSRGPIVMDKSQNNSTIMWARNVNTGASAEAGFSIKCDTASGDFFVTSSGHGATVLEATTNAILVHGSDGNMHVGVRTSHSLFLCTNDLKRWEVQPDGDLVMLANADIIPTTDNTGEVGVLGTVRFVGASFLNYRVYANQGDAEPVANLTTTGFFLGQGGASALSWRLFSSGANQADIDAGDILRHSMGSGTGFAKLQTIANVNTTSVGNVGTGEDDLITYALPANSLSAAAKGVRITATGTGANNANAKTLKVYFGSATLATLSLTANQANTWKVVADVFSTGTDTQDYNVEVFQDGTVEQHSFAVGTATQDDGAAITIKCTGEATSNDDIVQEHLLVEFLN
jgi:hypothetical protein